MGCKVEVTLQNSLIWKIRVFAKVIKEKRVNINAALFVFKNSIAWVSYEMQDYYNADKLALFDCILFLIN